jgi:LysM repeat protein
MVALEALNLEEVALRRRDHLHLVPSSYSTATYRVGSNLAQRRAIRSQTLQRRRRVAAVLLGGLVLAFLFFSSDPSVPQATGALSNSSALSAGQTYVVQGGETLSTIARLVNPEHPSIALASLEKQVGSSVVIPGEHLLIP